jgi:hypothetical protein
VAPSPFGFLQIGNANSPEVDGLASLNFVVLYSVLYLFPFGWVDCRDEVLFKVAHEILLPGKILINHLLFLF